MSSVAEGDCLAQTPSPSTQAARAKSGCWSRRTWWSRWAMAWSPRCCRSMPVNFGVSISAATFVITAFALMRLVSAPPAGLLVQRLGERRVYISGLVIVALSTGACAFAQTYWQLLLFRSLGGLGSAMFTVSSLGLMIRISPPDARGRVAGMFSSGVPDRVGRRTGARQPDRGLGSGGAVRHLRCRRCWSPRRWCSSACGIRAGRAGREYRARRLGADGACGTGPTGRRCSPTSRRAGRRSACASRWCRCSSSRCWIAAPASRAWRWRRSRSATSRPSSPAVICRTGSGAANC